MVHLKHFTPEATTGPISGTPPYPQAWADALGLFANDDNNVVTYSATISALEKEPWNALRAVGQGGPRDWGFHGSKVVLDG